MCKYCKDFAILNTTVGKYKVSTRIRIYEGQAYLISDSMLIEGLYDDWPIPPVVKIPISYCPFCSTPVGGMPCETYSDTIHREG